MVTIDAMKSEKARGVVSDVIPPASPVARGPLVEMHRCAGATLAIVNGWEVATRYPHEPGPDSNVLIDLAHWPTYEINGPETAAALRTICGTDVPPRSARLHKGLSIHRLTDRRAIIFDISPSAGNRLSPGTSIDVTGGWASIVLFGHDRLNILNKITALDLRESTLPVGGCCQGPIFGVNTLFARFEDRFELHVCTDSAEFLWEVLLDAGEEFGLQPAGLEYHENCSKAGV